MSTRTKATEHHDQVIRAQVVDDAGAAVALTDVERVTVKLFRSGPDDDASESIHIRNHETTDVMFGTFQTAGWTQDNVGYNLQVTIPGRFIGPGGSVIRAEVRVKRKAAGPIIHVFHLNVLGISG